MRFRQLAGSRSVRVLFWLAVLLAFLLAANPHPPHYPGEPSDKVQHMIAFATLGLLGAAAYPKASIWRLLAWLSLFGAAIELVQAIPVLHRDSDIMDWAADTVAAGVVLLCIAWQRAASRLD